MSTVMQQMHERYIQVPYRYEVRKMATMTMHGLPALWLVFIFSGVLTRDDEAACF